MKFLQKTILVVGAIGIGLIGCTPEQRLKRLIKRHPHLLNAADTIVVRDTAIIEASTHDTIISVNNLIHSTDTITLVNNRVTQRIYYKHDSLYIYAHCKPDTIYFEKVIVKPKIDVSKIPPETDYFDREHLTYYILIAVVLAIIFKAADYIFFKEHI